MALRKWIFPAFIALLASCSGQAPSRPEEAARTPFDAGVEGLPDALPSRIIAAGDGDTVRLAVRWVAKRVSGRKVRMLGYDGSIPGPTLKIPQGARITLLLTNETGLPTSLHSHGVRLDYDQDGVPGPSHPPLDSGQTRAYSLRFPDPGAFWYHPHVREDYGLELGLYGNYLVVPRDPDYWPPAHREATLMLDDILLEGGAIRPFYRDRVDHTLMGRFGNVFLVNGDTAFTMRVKHGEVIRFFATNAAGARVFRLELDPSKEFNRVGADNGRYEYTSLRESDIIAPSERRVFHIRFDRETRDGDTLRLYHSYTQGGGWTRNLLAAFVYDGDSAAAELPGAMEPTRSLQVAADIEPFRAAFHKPPDKVLELTGTMDMSGLSKRAGVQDEPEDSDALGIEWSDGMGLMSRGSHDGNTRWILRDDETGKENHAIDWVFRKGDKVLIRIYNDAKAAHAMPHPIHFHGQRFLVVREQGRLQAENLVWRDSYLIGRGYTVDLLLDASNPGEWMMHCHIPEHLGAQMMGHFKVLEDAPPPRAPFAWSLGLRLDSSSSSPGFLLRGDTLLTARAAGEIAGRVEGFDPAVLAPSLIFRNADIPSLSLTVPLDAQGRFRFAAADLLGEALGRTSIHISPKVVDPAYRAIPHKIRLTLDRAERHPWSLDLDLDGEAAFAGLRADTSAAGAFASEFSGRVNGFDPAFLQDTVFFVNVQYPMESTARAPLGPDGSFRFDAFDVLGGTDGVIFVDVLVKSRTPGRKPSPEVIRLTLERALSG